MTRGNQRELARAKAAKKAGASGTKQSDTTANAGLSIEERKLRDADRMREKQVAAEAKRQADAAAAAKK